MESLLDALLGPLCTSLGEAYAESRAQPAIGGRDSRGYDREPTFPQHAEDKQEDNPDPWAGNPDDGPDPGDQQWSDD
jgi:hypothetical protein